MPTTEGMTLCESRLCERRNELNGMGVIIMSIWPSSWGSSISAQVAGMISSYPQFDSWIHASHLWNVGYSQVDKIYNYSSDSPVKATTPMMKNNVDTPFLTSVIAQIILISLRPLCRPRPSTDSVLSDTLACADFFERGRWSRLLSPHLITVNWPCRIAHAYIPDVHCNKLHHWSL